MQSDFFQAGNFQASLPAGRGHPLNPAAPLFNQVEFVEDPPNHAIPQLRDTSHNILDRQAERQKSGILDLDSVIKQRNSDRRLLGVSA